MNEEEITKCEEFISVLEGSLVPSGVVFDVADYFYSMRPTITYAHLVEHLYDATYDYCYNRFS